MSLPSLGYTPQGEAADCKSVAEKHAWFDSKVTHQYPNAAGLRHFKAIMSLKFFTPRGLLGDGRRPFKLEKRVRNPSGGPITLLTVYRKGRRPITVHNEVRLLTEAPTRVGLLGDGRWPLKPEKRVRNSYAGPIECLHGVVVCSLP